MKGLELCKAYYEEYGKPMLAEKFPELLPHIACGAFGSGSQYLGYDDEHSEDHDFWPGFLILLPGEEVVSRRAAFLLERAYAALPKSFRGYQRSLMAPQGGPRDGVMRTEDIFLEKTGTKDGSLTAEQWLYVPEQSLLEATCGQIWYDGSGEVSAVRERLAYFPEDIRRKKLAGCLALMGQSGQYNYTRCTSRGETGAAQLAVFEFAKNCMHAVFLLNRRYEPYYKWSFHAMRELPVLGFEAELLEYLITTDNDEAAEEKYRVIEGIAADVIDILIKQNLTNAICGDLSKHAVSVNDGIADAGIRNMDILAGV